MISPIGDIASIIGALIALIGFWITIHNVRRSKRAANRAETAANRTLESIRHIDTVQSLAEAIAIAKEIQRLNRSREWKVVLDRHSSFRSVLIAANASVDDLDEEHKSRIQAGIAHSQSMSNKIEIALDKSVKPTGMPQMNRILSEQVEKLEAILAKIRTETEG